MKDLWRIHEEYEENMNKSQIQRDMDEYGGIWRKEIMKKYEENIEGESLEFLQVPIEAYRGARNSSHLKNSEYF